MTWFFNNWFFGEEAKAPRFFLGGLFVFYVFLSLSKFVLPATDRDESRFAQASKQMIETGDFTRVNFLDQPRHKKPIGIYWLQAGATQAMKAVGLAQGDAEIWTYRLPTLICGFLALLMFFKLFSMLVPSGIAAFSTGLLAVSLLFMVESHLAKADTVLLFFIVTQQGFLARWYQNQMKGRPTSFWMLFLLWSAVSLGVFIKGPVAPFIFLLTFVTLKFWFKQPIKGRSLNWPLGLILIAGLNIPWFLMLQSNSGGAYAAHAIGVDFLPKLFKGQESHGFYPGYYTLLSPILLWPGSFFVLRTIGNWRKITSLPMARFALAWVVPAWICFELISTKLPHYVLPLIPGVFLLSVLTLKEFGASRPAWVTWGAKAVFWGVALLLGGLLIGGAAFSTSYETLFLVGGALVGLFLLQQLVPQISKGVLFFGVPAVLYVGIFLGTFPSVSLLWLSEEIKQVRAGYPDKPVQVVGFNEPSLFFVNGTEVTSVSLEGAVAAMKERPDLLTFLPKKDLESFKNRLKTAYGEGLKLAVQGEERGLQQPILSSFNYSKGKNASFVFVVME